MNVEPVASDCAANPSVAPDGNEALRIAHDAVEHSSARDAN